MLRKFLLLIFIILSMSLIFAQRQQGVRLGVNLANITGKDLGDVTSLTGFHSGAFQLYQFSDDIAIQLEAIYTIKGAKNEFTFQGWDGDIPVKEIFIFHYLEMPLLFKYNISRQKFRFQPYAGPSLALLVASTREYTIDWYGEIETGTDDMGAFTKDIEYGINFGLDVFFPFLSQQLLVGLRYNLGLSEIFENIPQKAKNRVLMFNFGYILREKE